MIAFADAFALIAWVNARDHFHTVIRRYLDTYVGRLVTTEWVLVEVVDALSAPGSRTTVASFIRDIHSDPMFQVVGYESAIHDAGFQLFAARADKSWSLTDCISFVVMTNLGIREALTQDRHFEQAGFHSLFSD